MKNTVETLKQKVAELNQLIKQAEQEGLTVNINTNTSNVSYIDPPPHVEIEILKITRL